MPLRGGYGALDGVVAGGVVSVVGIVGVVGVVGVGVGVDVGDRNERLGIRMFRMTRWVGGPTCLRSVMEVRRRTVGEVTAEAM